MNKNEALTIIERALRHSLDPLDFKTLSGVAACVKYNIDTREYQLMLENTEKKHEVYRSTPFIREMAEIVLFLAGEKAAVAISELVLGGVLFW